MRRQTHRIAHILPWSSVGGVEQATLRIAQAVEGAGFESVAFCLDEAEPVVAMFTEAGFETALYRGVEPSYRHPKVFLRASFALAHELKKKRIDLVHCSDLLAGHRTAFAARLAGIPVLCHIRCRFSEVSRRDRSFLWHVNRFVFVSHHTWQQFGYRITPERGTVVYDGIEADEDAASAKAARQSARAEFNFDDNNIKVIGMVARVAPAKDYETLIKAAKRVIESHNEVRFLIVGDCSTTIAYREHYRVVKQMLADNGVAPYFVFTDFRDDVARLIHAMDICTLSTHDEGLPLVILEAMSAAKPIVATAVGGIPEVIRDNTLGLLYPHKDDAQLAAHLLSLVDDEQYAVNLGEAARLHVKRSFSREQFAANMVDLYNKMLSVTPAHVTLSRRSDDSLQGIEGS